MDSSDFEDYKETFERRFRSEKDRRTFAKVFDAQTLDTIQDLAAKGHIDVLEHIISTGKEAHVFAATDNSGNVRAVKIYKKETTDFKRMSEYITGDRRFDRVRKDARNIIYAWAKKEFKNLSAAATAKLPTPMPLACRENVLVMEFIGEADKGAPRLKEVRPSAEQVREYYSQLVDFIAKFYSVGLVHADLSEYNILVYEDKIWVIDFAQAVVLSHPKSKEFFMRDLENLAAYFSKRGVQTSQDKMLEDVRARKKELESRK